MDPNEYIRNAKLAQAGYANALIHVMDGEDEANYILRLPDSASAAAAAAPAAAAAAAPDNLLQSSSRGLHVPHVDQDEIDANNLRKEALDLVLAHDSDVFEDEHDRQRWSAAGLAHDSDVFEDEHDRQRWSAAGLAHDSEVFEDEHDRQRWSDTAGDSKPPASQVIAARGTRSSVRSRALEMPPGAYAVMGQVAVARPQDMVMTPMQQYSSRNSMKDADADTASRIGTMQPPPPATMQDEGDSNSIPQTLNGKWRIYGLVAAFITTAALVGLGVVLSKRNNRAQVNKSTNVLQQSTHNEQKELSLVDSLLLSCASYGSTSHALNSAPLETIVWAESLQVILPQLGTEMMKSTTCDAHALAFWWLVEDDKTYSNEAKWERYICVLLYFMWGGNDWHQRTNWLSRSPLCSWGGITCAPGVDVVRDIDLSNNNLVGSMPTELGQFTFLEILALSSNGLFGSIPIEIALVSNLKILKLDKNKFTGTIPSVIGLLTDLSEFELSSNQFIGTIPLEIGNVKNLMHLNLGENLLEGPFPPQVWTLLKLEDFVISGNYVSSSLPTEIGLLTNLSFFEANGSKLTGTIPTEIGLCASLKYFVVHTNHLQGTIPSQLSESHDLIRLTLFNNKLSGTMPAGICELPLLKEASVESSCSGFDLSNTVVCPTSCCIPGCTRV